MPHRGDAEKTTWMRNYSLLAPLGTKLQLQLFTYLRNLPKKQEIMHAERAKYTKSDTTTIPNSYRPCQEKFGKNAVIAEDEAEPKNPVYWPKRRFDLNKPFPSGKHMWDGYFCPVDVSGAIKKIEEATTIIYIANAGWLSTVPQ